MFARRFRIEPDFEPKLCSCGHLDQGFVTLVNAWQVNELKMEILGDSKYVELKMFGLFK